MGSFGEHININGSDYEIIHANNLVLSNDQYFMESDETLTGFLSYLAAEGKHIPTYGSDHVDFRKITGYPEFIITTIPDEKDQTLKFSDF